MIEPDDLTGVDATVALRLIATARSIAPCIDSLVDPDKATAVAILLGVAAEVPAPGMARMKSQSRNGTSATWGDYSSAFSADDRAALRALCGASTGGGPVGSFPVSTVARGIWCPEEWA